MSECFFVKVRKASGRSVAGGRIMGRMVVLGAFRAKGFRGWTGVPKAGEDDGKLDDTGMFLLRKMGAGVLSIVAALGASRQGE